jgi:hypothetical protein
VDVRWRHGQLAAEEFREIVVTPEIYSHAEGELVAGRFMYDVFAWRSEITARSIAQAQKPPHAISRSPDSLDYALLPDYRSRSPRPPIRSACSLRTSGRSPTSTGARTWARG